MTRVRWQRQGGDVDLVMRVAVYGVAFGVIGARAYHDLTSWSEVPTPKWQGVFEVWRGGLGVWGGIFLGAIAGVIVVRRAGQSGKAFLDAAAPGLLLAQGVGRIGNWWNQELFGKPTNLPWGLKIDVAHRPEQYVNSATFHPTFLYELIWNLVGVALLLWIARRYRIRPPALFSLYVAYYCFGRFFEELLRIDPSHHIAGLRLNAWVSIVALRRLLGVLPLVAGARTGRCLATATRLRDSEASPGAPGAEDERPEGPRPVARLACRAWRR